jgi:putative membrane protein
VRILLRWAAGAAALYLTVFLAQKLGIKLGFRPGSDTIVTSFIVVLALTLVNALIRPLVALLAMPLTCLTFGLFSFVINALMFLLVGKLDLGLYVGGFIPALFGSVVMSLISGVLSTFIGDGESRERRR